MREKKIPFFKKILMSIKDLDKYNILISEKFSRAIFYFLGLMTIFTLILSAVLTYKTNQYLAEFCDYTNTNIPNFTIDSQGLNVESEEPVILRNDKEFEYKLILDESTTDEEKYISEMTDYNGIIGLALQDRFIVIADSTQTEVKYEDLLSNFQTEQITKESMLNLIEDNIAVINSTIYLSIFVASYIIYTISTLIDVLALSLLVIIISKMAKISLKYSQCLMIAIYSITLPIIVNLIYLTANILTGFYMPYFQIMYTLISYIYIVAVILIMRSDLIKKKELIKATIEINKLEKEQNNKENPDEKKKEDDEKKEKNDKEKDDTLGEVKKRVKGKLKEDKNNPEPQANIEGGKR